MRLKEIKHGMVVHCKNIAEYKRLEEETIKNGYGELPLHNQSEDFIKKVVFYINDKNTLWGELKKNYIEFSDLIMPDLTAEEAIEWLGTYYNVESVFIETFGDDYCISGLCSEFTPKGVVEKISKWKSDHEKKESEIEWVYRVFGAENFGEKFFQTEDEAIKRCEELAKSQKTKQYARYERVCRVKAVE